MTNSYAINNVMVEHNVTLRISIIFKTKDDKAINKVRYIMNTAKQSSEILSDKHADRMNEHYFKC